MYIYMFGYPGVNALLPNLTEANVDAQCGRARKSWSRSEDWNAAVDGTSQVKTAGTSTSEVK
jgi:hypothetical protein